MIFVLLLFFYCKNVDIAEKSCYHKNSTEYILKKYVFSVNNYNKKWGMSPMV